MYEIAFKLYSIGIRCGDPIINCLFFSEHEKRDINNYLAMFEYEEETDY